jgi:hypothetical protein
MGRLTYLLHKIKTFFRYISTPAWRWATLFLLWGAGHYGLYDFILKTSLTALNTPKDFFLRLSVWCGIWLLAIILCFLSHLPGIYFAPWRSVRLCLKSCWVRSITFTCLILAMHCLFSSCGEKREYMACSRLQVAQYGCDPRLAQFM